jgi:uncharacterized protein with NRDE domain
MHAVTSSASSPRDAVCLILFAYRAHPAYRLVAAANRDEWFRRPAAPAGFWPDAPGVFGGRDLEANGTWMGITRTGRFAALTNFRDPAANRPDAPSRGALVRAFLTGDESPRRYLESLDETAERYNGFSLLVGDRDALLYFSNHRREIVALEPGVYGLSNNLLDVPWPKVREGKARLARRLNGSVDADGLLEILGDARLAPDDELPQTGVALDWERRLSALKIVTPEYGTRSSTALLLAADGAVTFVERSFDRSGAQTGTVRERFTLDR